MKDNPLSRRWRCGEEGRKRVERLRMLEVEFQPRSRVGCAVCVCCCVLTGLVLGVMVNLVVSANFQKYGWLWLVSNEYCPFRW